MTKTTSDEVQDVRSGRVSHPRFDYILLAAPCFSTPMLLWAENYVGVGHPGRLVMIGTVAWTVSAVLLATVRSLRVPRLISLVGVWGFSYMFMRGAVLVDALGYVSAILATTAVILIVGLLLSRRHNSSLRVVVALASAALAAEIAFAWYASAASLGEDHTLPAPQAADVTLERTPDIVLIVADAYVGLDGLERYFGVSEPAWKRDLLDRGFRVPDVAYSPYVTTETVLPAILDIAYPIETGPGITKATTRALYDRIGGDNRIVRILASNGYEITMVESGWSGSTCGEEIDTCVLSPFLDESTFFALRKTWLGRGILERFGYSFTIGALDSMRWLEDNLKRITHDSKPDLVVAHLEIPHPPFFLDSECEVDTSPARSGVTLQWPDTDISFRKEAYLEQAACFDSFVLGLTEQVSEDTVLLVTGDHGSDSHHQLAVHPTEWSEDAIRERLNVMFAYRAPAACELAEPILLVNIFGDVLECLGDPAIPRLEPRMFIYAGVSFDGARSPVVGLSSSQVNQLLSR